MTLKIDATRPFYAVVGAGVVVEGQEQLDKPEEKPNPGVGFTREDHDGA